MPTEATAGSDSPLEVNSEKLPSPGGGRSTGTHHFPTLVFHALLRDFCARHALDLHGVRRAITGEDLPPDPRYLFAVFETVGVPRSRWPKRRKR